MLCMTSFVHATNVVNVLSADNSTFENNNLGNWNSWGNSSSRSVGTPGYESNYCLKLVNPSAGTEYYSAQAALSVTLENGKTYYMKFMAKAENAHKVQIVYQNHSTYSGGGYQEVQLTNDWEKYEVRLDVDKDDMDQLLINFGKYADTYYFDNIEFGEEAVVVPDVYPVGNLLSQDQWGFEKGKDEWFSWNNNPSLDVVERGYESDHCLMATVSGEGGNEWGAQAMLQLDSAPEVGGVYTVSFRAKAEKTANISFVMSRHEAPHLSDGISINPISLTTEWAQYTGDVTIHNEGEDRLTFNVGNVATNYYIDNVSVVLKKHAVHPTGVSLNKTTAEVGVGSNITLVATVAPAEATNKNVTWESDATGIATVDENGVVTGVSEGTANITVTTEDGSFQATCAVTVAQVVLDWAVVHNNLTSIEYAWDNDTKTLYLRGEGAFSNSLNYWDYAFKNTCQSSAENIVIEGNITALSNGLFDSYRGVSNITITAPLETVGTQTFKQTAITSIDLSNTKLTSMPNNAFEGCDKLVNITLPSTYETINGEFNGKASRTFTFHSIPTFTNALNSPTSVSIILDDAEHPFIANATTNMPTIASAEYKRNVAAAYSTICLPFEVSELGGVKVYEMSDASDESITLSEVQSIQAGKPYVVATANIDFTAAAPAITVATTPAEAGSMQLIGVMQKTVIPASAKAYGLKDGLLHLNQANMTVNPMRAYFKTTAAQAPAREISFSFGEATAISNVAAESDIVAVYGANGARQARLTKGVNLVKTANGNIMKVIVK